MLAGCGWYGLGHSGERARHRPWVLDQPESGIPEYGWRVIMKIKDEAPGGFGGGGSLRTRVQNGGKGRKVGSRGRHSLSKEISE